MNSSLLYAFDNEFRKKHKLICGVDEAGRGPLAGPVCCAAVILDNDLELEGINDSKKLTEKKREQLFPLIIKNAVAYNIVFISPKTIDEINILNATMLGMQQSVNGLEIKPNFILVDGNRCPDIGIESEYVIGGDAKSASIAAASILAKVSRDHLMQQLAEQYPQYGLEKHKGYGTKLHYEMIEKYGIQEFHRRTFLKNRGY